MFFVSSPAAQENTQQGQHVSRRNDSWCSPEKPVQSGQALRSFAARGRLHISSVAKMLPLPSTEGRETFTDAEEPTWKPKRFRGNEESNNTLHWPDDTGCWAVRQSRHLCFFLQTPSTGPRFINPFYSTPKSVIILKLKLKSCQPSKKGASCSCSL